MKPRILIYFLLLIFVASGVFSKGSAETSGTGSLTIYTYDSFPEALETSVRSALPDTEVVVERFVDSGGLFTQVVLEKDDPKADVVIGLDTTYLPRAFAEDLFQPYKPPNVKFARVDLIVDQAYRVVAYDYGSVVLNYDSEALPDPPATWDALLDESLRDSIILMNPATSSPGRNFLLFTIAEFGEEGYLDYWEKLKPNILTVSAGWSEGYGLYTQGEAPIVLSYDTSPAYHKEYESETRYKNLLFGGKGYVQIEVAGITRKAANPVAARACIDHILTVDFQNLIPLNQFMYPVHADAELPEAFRWAGPATKFVSVDAELIDEKMNEWLEAWEGVMR